MKSKSIQIVLTVVCIAVIALSIYLNPDIIRAISYEELTQDEPPVYSGVINIWQISSWRVAQSSKTLCLLDAAEKFEKKNPFVFIEVANVTVEEYERNIAMGNYPDVLSFPAEMEIELDKCAQITNDTPLLPILQQTYYAADCKVIPWQYTSSVVVVNSKAADKKQADTSKNQSSSQLSLLLNTLAGNESSILGSIYALVPFAASDAAIDTTPMNISPYSGWNGFVTKESSIIYGSIWQRYSMDRLIDREKGFDCEYIIPSGDIPQFYWTQNICVFSTDTDKNTVINNYINMLLSDNYQIKIADTTASFPVTYAKLDYDGIRYDIVSSDYAGAMAIIPGMGISYDEIVSALHGDIGAKENLKGKLLIQ